MDRSVAQNDRSVAPSVGTPPPASASAECRFGKPHSAAEPFPPRDANSAEGPQFERGEPRTGDLSNRGPHPAAERGLPPRRPLWGVVYEWLLVAGIVGYFGLLLLAQRGLVELALMWRATGDFDTWTVLTTLLVWLLVLAVIGYSLVVAARVLTGLLTPVLDQAPEAREGVPLPRSAAPRLHQLVGEVAAAVRAPVPDEVRVSPGTDCYAMELRRFGVLPQRHLVLVLGLPHLLVMSREELRVVLGHELAHFGLGDTWRGVFVYRFIRSLQRAVDHPRPGARRWLDPLWLYTAAYLWGFRRLAAPLQQHQEFRADAISAQLAGGELAARTLLKHWLVAHQFHAVVSTFNPAASCENVFRLFAANWRELSPQGQAYLRAQLEERETGSWWDSHPTVAQRIEQMRLFPQHEPASEEAVIELLGNLPELLDTLQADLLRRTPAPGGAGLEL